MMPRQARSHDNYVRIAEYLLSLGYNLVLAGYCQGTALYNTIYVKDPGIARFLLEHGADPNAPSYIGDEYGLGRTALDAAGEDGDLIPDPNCVALAKILLRWGALPKPPGETWGQDYWNEWIDEQKAKGQWDQGIEATMTKYDAALVHSALHLLFFHTAMLAREGGDIHLRDAMSRNLLQIVLEDAKPEYSDHFQDNLQEMALMLLCGLKLRLSAPELEQAKRTCAGKGYQETLAALESVSP